VTPQPISPARTVYSRCQDRRPRASGPAQVPPGATAFGCASSDCRECYLGCKRAGSAVAGSPRSLRTRRWLGCASAAQIVPQTGRSTGVQGSVQPFSPRAASTAAPSATVRPAPGRPVPVNRFFNVLARRCPGASPAFAYRGAPSHASHAAGAYRTTSSGSCRGACRSDASRSRLGPSRRPVNGMSHAV